LVAHATAENARIVADTIATIQPRCPGSIAQQVSTILQGQLKAIASDGPPDNAHGNVLLLAELFVRGMASMAVIKEMLMVVLFTPHRPHDHCVNLSCHAVLIVGPVLDRCPTGKQMADLVVRRLKELKGGNVSVPTKTAITDIIELHASNWHVREKKKGSPNAKGKAGKGARRQNNRVAQAEEGTVR